MITFSPFGILQLRQAKHYCSFPSLSLRKLTVTEAWVELVSPSVHWTRYPAEFRNEKTTNYKLLKPFNGKFRKFRDENDGNGISGKKES